MSYLTDQTIGNIPIVHNYEYASLNAAQSATWLSGDVFKAFRITDDPLALYIILTSGGDFARIPLYQKEEAQTTNDTETSIDTFDTTGYTDYTFHVHAKFQATIDGGGNAATYERKASFKNDSGTLSQIGSTTDIHTAEDTAGWDVDIDANSLDIRFRIKGQAATATTNFTVEYNVHPVKNS